MHQLLQTVSLKDQNLIGQDQKKKKKALFF